MLSDVLEYRIKDEMYFEAFSKRLVLVDPTNFFASDARQAFLV